MQPTRVHHTNIMTSHVRHAERIYTTTPNMKEAKHPHQTHARQVTMADFEEALSKISKSVGLEDIRKHQKWMEEFGAT